MVSANDFYQYNILKKYHFMLLISYFKQHHSTMQTKYVVHLAKSRPGSVSFPFHLSSAYLIIFTAVKLSNLSLLFLLTKYCQ